MTNVFYAPGEQRAERVKALFARIASRYDLINDLQSFGLHRYWKARLASLGGPNSGGIALDVCCGTGDLSLAFARGGAQVVGLDFSRQMLGVALKRKAKGQRLKAKSQLERQWEQYAEQKPQPGCGRTGSLDFVQGDALKLPFSDNTFDIVSVGYGLRNLAGWSAGLKEMERVAKAGGRLLVLDLGKPDNALWRNVYYSYLRLFVPCLGWLFCGNASAYAYLLESLKHYPAQHGVAARMRDMGLRKVRVINLLGGAMSINYGEK